LRKKTEIWNNKKRRKIGEEIILKELYGSEKKGDILVTRKSDRKRETFEDQEKKKKWLEWQWKKNEDCTMTKEGM